MSYLHNLLNSRNALFLLKILHYAFLLAILKEHLSDALFILLIGASLLLLMFAYSKTTQYAVQIELKDAVVFPCLLMGALLTYFLTAETTLGVVLSACIVGSVFALIPSKGFWKAVSAMIYCGVCIGMTGFFVAQGYFFIMLASLLGSIIWILVKGQLNGFGGKLGTIAFGGVCAAALLTYLIESL